MKRIVEFFKGNSGFIATLAVLIALNMRFDFYFVRTGSMEPSIRTGAVVMADPFRFPEPGDIAAYRSGSITVIHRVVSTDGNGFIFMGDSNRAPDPYVVPAGDIEGTIVFRLNAAAPIVNALSRMLHGA